MEAGKTTVQGLIGGSNGPLSVLAAISLPPLNVAEVLAGRTSLVYRNVRWVQVMHWPSSDFVRPGDLVVTTAVAPSSSDAVRFLEDVVRSDAAALIVSQPPGATDLSVLDEVVKLARTLEFPVLSLPWEVPFADVSRTIITRLMRGACIIDDAACGLRHSTIALQPREADMTVELSRAMALRTESAPVAVALGHPGSGPNAEDDFSRLIEELEALADNDRLQLRICLTSKVCLLVLEGHLKSATLRHLLDEARKRVGDVSTHWVVADQKADDGSDSTEDQIRSVQVARQIIREGNDWVATQSLESLFVLGAMAQSPLISTVVTEAVGALVSYDRQNRRNLLETLQVFLDESCNTSAAARRLFLNRHSLMYRLRKIEELTSFSLKEPADRFFLQACVRLYRYRLVDEAPDGLVRPPTGD